MTPAPAATAAPGPPLAEAVFNGDFEDPVDLDGWETHGADAVVVTGDGGNRAAAITTSSAATRWIDQVARVTPGGWYAVDARLAPGDGVDAAWVRLAWYASDDGSGSQLSTDDSPSLAGGAAPASVALAAAQAPPDAQSVRVRLMLRPAGDAPATLTVDDVHLGPTDAPPAGAGGAGSGGGTDAAPVLLGALFNGNFEDPDPLRGWSAHAADVSPVERAGGHAASLTSSGGSSTKWLETLVHVEPGHWYLAAAFLAPDAAAEGAWLRVAWYGPTDGSGGQLSTDDSAEVPGGLGAIATTGPVEAPANASSARVRLMLRPRSDLPASLVADDAWIVATSAPPPKPATSKSKHPKQQQESQDVPILDGALFNTDFAVDVGLDGWTAHGGDLQLRALPGGGRAAVLLSTTASTKWVDQRVRVQAGQWYAAGARLAGDAGVDSAWVRVAWYRTGDASGSQISRVDSRRLGGGGGDAISSTARAERIVAGSALAELDTGPVQAPDGARSARLRIMLHPRGAAPATLTIGSASFSPASGPAPAPTPAARTHSARATLRFEGLLNGDFDSAPDAAGWSSHGGSLALGTGGPGTGRAALLGSASTSTKWLEQAVLVTPGAHYRLAAALAAGAGVDRAWVRVAWYATVDGGGSQLAVADSSPIGGGATAVPTTLDVTAPLHARSARVRVMLRPAGAGAATLTVDDVRFARTAAVAGTPPAAVPTASPSPSHASQTARDARPAPPALRLPRAELGASQRLLRLTELLPNPPEPGSDADYEWIELTNVGRTPAALAGATLADNRGSIVLPDLVLAPGMALLIAGARADVSDAFAYYPPGGFANGLGNSGDHLVLTDAAGRRVDALDYGADRTLGDAAAHTGAPGVGKSIDRRFDDAGRLLAAQVTDAPTPGRATVERRVVAPVPVLLPPTTESVRSPAVAPRRAATQRPRAPIFPTSTASEGPGAAAVVGAGTHRTQWLAVGALVAVAVAVVLMVRVRRRRGPSTG